MSTLSQFFGGGSEFADLSKAIENGDQTKLSDLLQHYNYQYALCMMCGNSDVMDNSDFMNFIANNSDAMNAIVNSQIAMNTIVTFQTAMNAIANSQIAMNAIITSQIAMNAMWNNKIAISAIQNNSTETIIAGTLSYAAGSSTTYTTIVDCLNDSNVNSYIFSNLNTRQLFWVAEPLWTWDGTTSYLSNLINSHWGGASATGWQTQVSINDGKHYIVFIKFCSVGVYDWYKGIIQNYDGSNNAEVDGGYSVTKWLKHFTDNSLVTKFYVSQAGGSSSSAYADTYYIAVED